MTFEPVGGSASKKVDVRIIAATNFDLQEAFQQGRFLRDLLYRIEVIRIQLPPLRRRKDDIYLLVQHFIDRFARKYNKPVEGIEPEAVKALVAYPWPGNARELKNYVERAVILSKKPVLDLSDLPDLCAAEDAVGGVPTSVCPIPPLPEEGVTLQEMEKELIRSTLDQCRGNKSRAAQKLGISRKALYEKMARHGIR
jgi:DNA-binding NtrC family response regulator